MPKAFENCRKRGGRVRTEKIDKKHYRHVCYLGKKRYPGHKKTYKKALKGKK